MRIDQAKSIQMIDLLETLGHKPIKTSKAGNQAWYLSPLRAEKEPSFTVKVSDNCWNDFGGSGGNILDFVMEYQNTDLRGALVFLDNLNIIPASEIIFNTHKLKKENIISIQKTKPLAYRILINQLEEKGIQNDIAKKYLLEIYYKNGSQQYFGYGMQNDRGGYEVHNKLFKGATLKSPTTIKGEDSSRLTVFEGMTDFLSALQYYNITAFKTDVIIMHSRAFGTGLIRTIKAERQYNTIFLFLDNDASGQETTEQFITELEPEITIKAMNDFYIKYKDVNDFWQVYRNR